MDPRMLQHFTTPPAPRRLAYEDRLGLSSACPRPGRRSSAAGSAPRAPHGGGCSRRVGASRRRACTATGSSAALTAPMANHDIVLITHRPSPELVDLFAVMSGFR